MIRCALGPFSTELGAMLVPEKLQIDQKLKRCLRQKESSDDDLDFELHVHPKT